MHFIVIISQNKGTQTSVSQMGFELTIPVFERTKTVHCDRPKSNSYKFYNILHGFHIFFKLDIGPAYLI
jgi:hypothetical protein